MKMPRIFLLIFISVFPILVFETGARVYFWITDAKELPNPENFVGKHRLANYYIKKSPHPYLGYSLSGNRHYDYFEDSKNYTIVLSGGSVANDLCNSEFQYGYIRKSLQKKFNSKVDFRCLASGGFRQPQQAIAIAVYGFDADCIIAFEGVNEVLGSRWNHRPEFPIERISRIYFSDFNRGFYQQAGLFLLAKFENWIIAPDSSKNTSLSGIRLLKQFSKNVYLSYFNRLDEHKSKPLPIEKIVEIWRRGILTSHHLAESRGAKYLTLIQPQIFDKTRYTSGELEIVGKLTARGLKKLWNERFAYTRRFLKSEALNPAQLTDFLDSKYFDFDQIEFRDPVHFTSQGNQKILHGISKIAYQFCEPNPTASN